MAALLGREVVDKNYRKARIAIAFRPSDTKFEVSNPAIAKDPSWIPDISVVFSPNASVFNLVQDFCARNPGSTQDQVFRSIDLLRGITNNQIGLIELASDLDIETVTEIFVRVNSEGVALSQADFAMSKIAVNETYEGHILRKAIDYFCHLAVAPDFYPTAKEDTEFAQSEFCQRMAWLRNEKDDLYDPSYSDMLRVAFTSEFKRGRLEDLVSLLSGRNFETKQYEEVIVESSFNSLKQGIRSFINETNFKNLIMIIRSAGFVDASLVSSQNVVNFAYALYLALRARGIRAVEVERYVRRWFVMSTLTGRYSGSAETAIDSDIRQIDSQNIYAYADEIFRGELSEAFWEITLPRQLETSSASSPYFRVFQAAQVKLNDHGFLSRDVTVRELIEVKTDVHHLFPRDYLKKSGMKSSQYNQIANYAMTQSEINIAIGNKEPKVYFAELLEQCNGGPKRYGNIQNPDELTENLRMNCIPDGAEHMTSRDYPEFLEKRRRLMAAKIRTYFEGL